MNTVRETKREIEKVCNGLRAMALKATQSLETALSDRPLLPVSDR